MNNLNLVRRMPARYSKETAKSNNSSFAIESKQNGIFTYKHKSFIVHCLYFDNYRKIG